MTKFSRLGASVAFVIAAVCVPVLSRAQNPERVSLFPKLQVGQVLRYSIGYRANTHTDTESNVAAPMAPSGGHTDVNFRLVAEIADLQFDAGKPVTRIRTRLVEPDAGASPAAPPSSNASPPANADDNSHAGKVVEFSLHADGHITDPDGLDKLSPDEQAAWQEWLSRFAVAGTYPEKGVKPGDKWKADEAIPSSILAALYWDKESEYVNNESCGSALVASAGRSSSSAQGSSASSSSSSSQARTQEICAVILTTATLKQKSNPKDATPEDYRLHDLHTSGTASGKNEIISYISLKTGLLIRATEDARQTMNATVAKSDGSNRVHYSINAESHAQVLLL